MTFFVARRAELALLRGALDGLADGVGATVVVEGEPGIGKSRLLDEALLGVPLGIVTRRTGADEFEQDRPFALAARALGLGDATAWLGRELERDPGITADGAPVSDRAAEYRVVDAMLDALEAQTKDAPTVVVIDDLQWADSGTVRVLRTIVRRLEFLSVALLLSARRAPRPADLGRLFTDITARGGRRIPLERLTDDEAVALAAELAGGEPGPRLREQVGATAGNPLFVVELVAALEREGELQRVGSSVDAGRRALPPSLRLTILQGVSVLSVATQDALRLASVLGSSFSLNDLGAVAGLRAADLLALVQEALEAGVVREDGPRLAFRHDVVREAIYADLPEAVRRALHRDAATTLEAAGRPASVVAEHLALGAEAGDDQAVEALRRAAAEVGRGAPDTAVRLLERAAALTEDDTPRWAEIVADLLPRIVGIRKVVEIEELARRAEGLAPHLAGRIRASRLFALLADGRVAEYAALAATAAAAAPAASEERLTLQAKSAFGGLFLGATEASIADAEQVLVRATELGHAEAVHEALTVLALAADSGGHHEEAVALAERASRDADATAEWWGGASLAPQVLAMAWVGIDRLADSIPMLAQRCARAEAHGNLGWLAAYQRVLGGHRYLAGDWDDAVADLEAGLDLSDEADSRTGEVVAFAALAQIAVERGEMERAESVLAAAEERLAAAGPQPAIDLTFWCRGQLLEASGRDDEAVERMLLGWNVMSGSRYLFSTNRLIGPRLVARLVARGDRERAEPVVADLEEGARRTDVASARGAAARARGLLERDPDQLVRAVGDYRLAPLRAELAACAEDAAVVLTECRRPDEADTLWAEATGIYEALGARWNLDRVARLRGRTRRRSRGAAAVGWKAFTKAEATIVDLLAEGLTNRQIAERLFVSRRTVETHIRHIFQKTGLSSRSQVAVEAVRRTLPSGGQEL